jgi:hypothetical protein
MRIMVDCLYPARAANFLLGLINICNEAVARIVINAFSRLARRAKLEASGSYLARGVSTSLGQHPRI